MFKINIKDSKEFHGKRFFHEMEREGWKEGNWFGWKCGNTSCKECGAFFHIPIIEIDKTTIELCEVQTCTCN